ncbi:MAG TPA: zinc ribbon domain-containing protein [Chloroflexota bacterium]|nr:zinc ribbon domain-containing protein [Chloroflexota bacterium]
MPMYEFACQMCGQPFEKKLRMSQVGEDQVCPHCGSGETRRRFGTAVAIGGMQVKTVSPAPVRSPFT